MSLKHMRGNYLTFAGKRRYGMETANSVRNVQEMRLYRYDELSPEMKEKADRLMKNMKPGFTDTFIRSDLSQIAYEN